MLSPYEPSDQVGSSWSPTQAPVYADAQKLEEDSGERKKKIFPPIFIQTDSSGV